MIRTRLLWQLYPTFLVVLLVAFLGTSFFLTRSVKGFYLNHLTERLQAQATLAGEFFTPHLNHGELESINRDCKKLGQETGTRYTVILPDGLVIGDSDHQIEVMDNHAQRPEIAQAMMEGVGFSQRFSHTLQKNLIYFATRVGSKDNPFAVVRVALPLTAIDKQLGALQQKLFVGFMVGLVLAAAVSVWCSRLISRPMEAMQQGARRFAAGNFENKLPLEGSQEARDLALSLNQMAAQLDERLKTVIEQRNAQDAVLSSMIEGVLAIDNEERVLRINRAAAKLLGVEGKEVQGKGLHEVIRKTDVQAFVEKTLASDQPIQGEIELLVNEEDRVLQANGTLLRDAEDRQIGGLVVFNDVTRMRRLERMRRDFVANVSHELKTPITAIKGFVETLLDEDHIQESPQAVEFLNIAVNQADRLNAIIEDLLDLSRIEQDSEQEAIELSMGNVRPVVTSASQTWMMKAKEKGLDVLIEVPGDLQARINAPLLEQALINLVDNAIKYSPEGSEIRVEAVAEDAEVALRVHDQGCGIAAEHLPRLFERFYRVDKARSRKLGGTGLGLAIVKHIAQSHQGRVTVASELGEGTVFTLFIPQN